MLRMIAALLAAAVSFALAVTPAQAGAQSPDTAQSPDAKKPYVPHKTPDMKARTGAPKKPVAPKPPTPPKKPSNVPPYIYDRHGNAIPTSPDAYDVSSAKKKQ